MNNSVQSFNSGDLVEVLQPDEILKTLDLNGQLDGLPFMPEMISYCSKKFRVRLKVEKTCVTCFFPENGLQTQMMKEFNHNDVYFLEDLRCSGNDHGNCHRGCMLFWKQSWLKKANNKTDNISINPEDALKLQERLKTKKYEEKYFCQSTELQTATIYVSSLKRLLKNFREVSSGAINILQMVQSIILPGWRKLNKKSPQPKGELKKTPTECLNLEVGELVEVRAFDEIMHTLNKNGKNKGLRFTYDMRQYCGKQFRVRNILANMIDEGTGKMLKIKNTVVLKDVICTYSLRFAGCPRAEFHYWREIWLKRVSE